jgi:hypothetical protein
MTVRVRRSAETIAANDDLTSNAHAAPRRRGRPRIKKDKTPCETPFEEIASALRCIPVERKAGSTTPARKGRNSAKERARRIVLRDRRAKRASGIFGTLVDELRWNEGITRRGYNWLARECNVDRRTARRHIKVLLDYGHVSKRSRKRTRDLSDINEYTIPTLLVAWKEIEAEVGAEKSEGWGQKNGRGRGNSVPRGGGNSAPQSSGVSSQERLSSEDTEMWRTAMRGKMQHNLWSYTWGPAPGEAGCRVPPEILDEFDWQQAA